MLSENLHLVNNDEIDKNDKLAKIRPIADIVRNQCIEVKLEECHSVDEQIIPSKTTFSSIRKYNPKKSKNGTLIAWSVLGLPELCTIISFMKENQWQLIEMATLIMTIYKNQHKLLQSYVRIFLAIKSINCFFDNWFSTLELMLYFKNKGILAVGTIRLNGWVFCL